MISRVLNRFYKDLMTYDLWSWSNWVGKEVRDTSSLCPTFKYHLLIGELLGSSRCLFCLLVVVICRPRNVKYLKFGLVASWLTLEDPLSLVLPGQATNYVFITWTPAIFIVHIGFLKQCQGLLQWPSLIMAVTTTTIHKMQWHRLPSHKKRTWNNSLHPTWRTK